MAYLRFRGWIIDDKVSVFALLEVSKGHKKGFIIFGWMLMGEVYLCANQKLLTKY